MATAEENAEAPDADTDEEWKWITPCKASQPRKRGSFPLLPVEPAEVRSPLERAEGEQR
jgi:hypothetical protein